MNRFLALYMVLAASSLFGQQAALKKFVPKGFEILDSEKCDLNQDTFSDYILILKSKEESNDNSDLDRPLLIIEGSKNGALKLVERNDHVVLCFGCGGVFGDPYAAMTIKKNYFTIEHYGGSSWRWTKEITFKYDKRTRKYLLHKDAGESWNIADVNKREFHADNQQDWDKMEFKDYTDEDQ